MRAPPSAPEPTPAPGADAGAAPVDEDFLYHLYRGSELLVEGAVDEAKEALEQALRHQPEDAKGQDLLAGVYFRLGVYPRAIEIWDRLIERHPADPALRVNVALARLKTGQPADAIAPLQAALQLAPDHERAWGYLGLVYWRLGRFADARDAFLRAGQAGMARRMDEVLGAEGSEGEGAAEDAARGPSSPTDGVGAGPRSRRVAEAIEAAGHAVAALEVEHPALSARTSRPPPPPRRATTGQWAAVTDATVAAAELAAARAAAHGEDGEAPRGGAGSASPRARVSTMRGLQAAGADGVPEEAPSGAASEGAPRTRALPTPLADALPALRRDEVPALPGRGSLALSPTGGLLVDARVTVHVRRPALRWAAHAEREPVDLEAVLARRVAGRETAEPLGGDVAPFVALRAGVRASLEAAGGERVELLALRGEALFVREDALLAFESTLAHECGRVAVDARRAVDLVQLSGAGALALRVGGPPSAVRVGEGEVVVVRAAALLGWTGRLFPTAAPPGALEPLLAFRGDGDLLLG